MSRTFTRREREFFIAVWDMLDEPNQLHIATRYGAPDPQAYKGFSADGVQRVKDTLMKLPTPIQDMLRKHRDRKG